jgi:hypothetical protein
LADVKKCAQRCNHRYITYIYFYYYYLIQLKFN